jgi:hypothetical protein
VIECFSLDDFDATNWEQVQAAFTVRKPLEMKQFWLPQPEAHLEPAQVYFGWRPDAFYVFANLHDIDIYSESTHDGQPMWRLGDVFEIFLRVLPEVSWYEFHVTPNNHHLELCWPHDPETCLKLEKQQGYETFIVSKSIIKSQVRICKKQQCWQVLAEIPARLISGEKAINAGQEWLVSFCRYDAFQDERKPVLSSTSDFTKAPFSRQREWNRLFFVK